MPASTLVLPGTRSEPLTWSVRDVYLRHGGFMWHALQRLGVPDVDLDDALQEVLMVVHQHLDRFDPDRSKLTTWLFGICLRVAKHTHRRRRRRRESSATRLGEPSTDHTPEDDLEHRQAEARLRRILDRMSAEKRATFVLFELDGQSCESIAELMGVPVGTVHSRLHAARRCFARALQREGGIR